MVLVGIRLVLQLTRDGERLASAQTKITRHRRHSRSGILKGDTKFELRLGLKSSRLPQTDGSRSSGRAIDIKTQITCVRSVS
jgi:hypothetical protein